MTTTMNKATAVARLRDAWPREEFPDASIAIYADRLERFPVEAVVEAVNRLIDTEKFRPSVGQVIEEVAELVLDLPGVEHAWFIAERGKLREAPEVVRLATEYVGGRWAILHSDNVATIRAQFRTAYTRLRLEALRDYEHGRETRALAPWPGERDLGPTMAALPESGHVRPRPILSRLMVRWGGQVPGPPNEQEKADAILVLGEGANAAEPSDDPLYAEAERVFRGSSV